MRKKGRTAGRGPVRGRAAWTQVATLFRFRGRLCYFGYDQGNSQNTAGSPRCLIFARVTTIYSQNRHQTLFHIIHLDVRYMTIGYDNALSNAQIILHQ